MSFTEEYPQKGRYYVGTWNLRIVIDIENVPDIQKTKLQLNSNWRPSDKQTYPVFL